MVHIYMVDKENNCEMNAEFSRKLIFTEFNKDVSLNNNIFANHTKIIV